MVPINWFINKIAKPYVDKTNALNPSWTKYLCHVALVIGLILVPLSFVLCCYIAQKKKERKANEAAEIVWKETNGAEFSADVEANKKKKAI
jgi:hypothetical protein